jgi:hypothetical protein
MAVTKIDLSEKVLVSGEIKQALNAMKQPGERFGDVVARLVQNYKKGEFIAYLDHLAATSEFVPLDDDPEYREIKMERVKHDKHQRKGTSLP